ncbi:hypothetical protein QR680_018593 [Steinernema hermaphroditum]|uniref:Uncharacterized protein n=1 Tax=Steinernema hermaphroditum TaxID=289476 RepID=A0AA39HIH1_9BILA|nr:hypothetical protein QR680_018593 [Steinernema hermaphroditum]
MRVHACEMSGNDKNKECGLRLLRSREAASRAVYTLANSPYTAVTVKKKQCKVVLVHGSQCAATLDQQYVLLGAMLQSLSTGGQPSREVFDIDGVTSWPSLQIMAASSKPIRSKADAYKPLTLSFQTHCCCNRIDYDCEDRVRDLLHLDNMVQCSKPKCKRWAFWKCVGLTVDKINDDFHCNDCLVLPPVPKWEISIATNTCPLDNVLAILSVIIKVDPRFLRHVQTESEIENNWRTALTQIQYGKPDEGKHHLLSACVHASTTNVVNFFGGEYSLYGAQLENEGRYLLDLINTSSVIPF